MQAEVAKPPRVYPFELEPNDVTRNGRKAGPMLSFGCYVVYPVHDRSGSHYWFVEDCDLALMRSVDDDGTSTVRGGRSFDWVTEDFKSCFEDETNL